MDIKLKSNLWKMYLYKFISDMWFIVPIIIPFYISNGLTASQVFIVQAMYSVSVLLFEVPSGYLSDVIGRKRTLIIGSLCVPLGIGLYAFSHMFWQFVIAEFIIGIGGAMRSGTDSALIYDTLLELERDKEYKQFEGKAEFFMRIGTSLSAVLGGLFALVSIRLPFYINTITASTLVFIAFFLTEPNRRKLSATTNPLKDILTIVKYTLTHRQIIPVILFSSLILSTGIIGIWGYFLYFGNVNINIAFYGIIFAVLQLFSAFGAKHGHQLENKVGQKQSVFFLLAISLIFVSFGFVHARWLILLTFIHAFLWGISTPLFLDFINKVVGSEIRATVLSVSSMAARLSIVILMPLFGRFVDLYSLSTAFIIMGIYFIIVSSLSTIFMFQTRII